MVASVQQILGKINLDYSENGKELLKEAGSQDKISADKIKPKPLASHNLVYECSTETLEPVYFFILDLMNDFGLAPEKLIDNFASSPGSGHFSELGQRATIMQQQGAKILGDVNLVLRSVLNIVYDLKEFKIRMQAYEDLHVNDKNKATAARLSLKQLWLDKVDMIQKGNSSIKAMALSQAGFQTLLDAFLMVDNANDIAKLELNDRVKRILHPRIHEFNSWVQQSEQELKKRYELERTYLKSQVSSLKLYSRWAKPYLRAAQQLETKDFGRDPALVKVFNTLLLELTLLGKNKLKIDELAASGELPFELRKLKLKRDYFSCLLIDFKFRGIPQRVAQQSHYAFGGRVEVTFSAYALNADELKKLDKELEDSDLGDVLKLVEGITSESLGQLQKEIDYFLEEEKEKEQERSSGGPNPFLALIGYYDKGSSQKSASSSKKPEEGPVKKDDWIEKNNIRKLASDKSKETAWTLFDIYKKAHGMPSYTA
jgi:hypothetical protein